MIERVDLGDAVPVADHIDVAFAPEPVRTADDQLAAVGEEPQLQQGDRALLSTL